MNANRSKRHASLLLIPLLSAACATGLDPRHFDEAAYGMHESSLTKLLDAPTHTILRLFPERGDHREVRIDRCPGEHPHPDYFVVYGDDHLHAVLTEGRMQNRDRSEWGWSRTDVDELVQHLLTQRVPLTWRELEPIDALERSKGPDPQTQTVMTVLLMPPVWPAIALSPVLIPVTMWIVSGYEERQAATTTALRQLPRFADRQTVRAALGEPRYTRTHPDDPDVEVWLYAERDDATLLAGHRVGFAGDRLIWVQRNFRLSRN